MNRTGTYVAFDGLGEKDPAKSDFKFYSILLGWAENENIEFNITNSHDKACSVSDDSCWETLKKSIQQRFRGSKNMLVVLSRNTRKTGSVLSEEIAWAIDTYQIPLIIAYVDYRVIANPRSLSSYWPNALSSRIANDTTHAIHIPFAQKAILAAIKQFTPSNHPIGAGYGYYSEETYRNWGLLKARETFQHTPK